MKITINTLKIISLSAFMCLWSSNICIAGYHETNTTANEISTSTIEQIEYTFPEKDSGVLKNELDQVGGEDAGSLMNLINFKKPYFWLLMIALGLILGVLIRLFKKLSHMDKEYNNYRKKIIGSKNEIKDEDDILYSINETNELQPTAENSQETQKIKINKIENTEDSINQHNTIKVQSDESEHLKTQSSRDLTERIKISKDEKDDDYIFDE